MISSRRNCTLKGGKNERSFRLSSVLSVTKAVLGKNVKGKMSLHIQCPASSFSPQRHCQTVHVQIFIER